MPHSLIAALFVASACATQPPAPDGGGEDAGVRVVDAGDAGVRAFVSTDHAATVIVVPDEALVAVVTTAASEVRLFSFGADGALSLEHVYRTGREPRTLSVWGRHLVVTCQEAGTVELLRWDDPSLPSTIVELPFASRPYASVGGPAALWVTMQALGQVARIELPATGPATFESIPVIDDARGITRLPDGRLAVTRWRSVDGDGLIAVLDPADASVRRWTVPPDDRGGVVGYLDQLLVSPDGSRAALPSLRAGIGEGAFRSGRTPTPTNAIGAIVSWLDLGTEVEPHDGSTLIVDAGLASAGVFSSSGDHLFVALRGRRAMTRIDVATGERGPTIEGLGYAPDGLALSGDGRLLFVHASLSRELVVYDATRFSAESRPLARASTVDREPWPAVVLSGARLFSDSLDPRISVNGSIACAHCHLDGAHDGLVWDFTDRGEGLRNTISLRGWQHRPSDRPIHWSANFDEIEDFEHDIRGAFGGTGLLADADFFSGGRDEPLGARKRGFSAELRSIDTFLTSTARFAPSPDRAPNGSLPPAAVRGRALFEAVETRCTSCHASDALTDSRFLRPGEPVLHDVGTLGAGSGTRLGGPLTGLATPQLAELWESAPYLHDGSASTLLEVLTVRNASNEHGRTAHLSAAELDDLVVYLRCLDGRLD